MAGKLYEMNFIMDAKQSSGFKSTFSQTQAEFAKLGSQIQALNKTPGDITAYQKQSAAVENTKAKLIMGTAGTVGAVTAAVTAFSAAKKAAAAIDLAAMFATADPILAVGAAIGRVVGGIIALTEAANEGVPNVKELTEAAQEVSGAMEQASAGFDASRINIAATADMAGVYIDRLEELDAKTALSEAETQEYHNILQLLTDTVPELAGAIDLTTDSIDGGTEALRAQTEAWEKNAKVQAYHEALKDIYAAQAEAELEHQRNTLLLTEAQTNLRDIESERADILRQMQDMESGATPYDAAKYHELEKRILALNSEYMDADVAVGKFEEAVRKSEAAVEGAKSETKGYSEALGALIGDTQEAVSATRDTETAVLSMADSLRSEASLSIISLGAAFGTDIPKLAEPYREMYQEAYESISGQMGLFEAMSVEVETPVDTMISALERQAAYMASYSDNLRAVSEMGLSDELVAQLSDGSTESAAYLQEIVNNGQGKIQELNDAFAEVEKGKKEFSDTVAELQTDLKGTMDEAVRNVDDAVREMDMYLEASLAAKSTMQGFIDGANSMAAPVQSTYRNIVYGTMSAMQGVMGAGLTVTRGYATGTESAEPGFAMVGENGPELMFFHGGEQVINATQTAALQRQSALVAEPVSALPMSASNSEVVINLSPVYNLSGNMDTQAVRNELDRNNEKLKALMRNVIEQYIFERERAAAR